MDLRCADAARVIDRDGLDPVKIIEPYGVSANIYSPLTGNVHPLLNHACDPTGRNRLFGMPWKQKGRVYATDGAIAVIQDNTDEVYPWVLEHVPAHAAGLPDQMEQRIAATGPWHAMPLAIDTDPDCPLVLACKTCGGTGLGRNTSHCPGCRGHRTRPRSSSPYEVADGFAIDARYAALLRHYGAVCFLPLARGPVKFVIPRTRVWGAVQPCRSARTWAS